MFPVGRDFILEVSPRFSGTHLQSQRRIVGAISPVFAATLATYGIDRPLRIAHFMGQVTHECAGFRTTMEFASGRAYEGRRDLGNTQPGDGPRFKGRGLIQLTGRANYQRYGQAMGLDLEGDPDLAAEPVHALAIACEYWKDRDLNAPADEDDLRRVTRLVNGGTNGIEDRRKYLIKAKAALAAMQGILVANREGGTSVVLRRGSDSDAVGDLQHLLRQHGYAVTIDNDFGAGTETAVKSFQRQNGLVADGIVGEATWKKLRA